MKISLDWLGDFVTWQGTPEELAARLTAGGLNVESLAEASLSLPEVVVARVQDVQAHPDATSLHVCQVHDGSRTLSVVCGAPNVRAGQHVLLARPGAVLPGGVKIKVARLRGVESQGMICSERELGIGAEAGGIIELPEASTPGTPADELYGYRDIVLDIEVTPNRPDWLCHYGVAREVAALTGVLLGAPAVWTPPKTAGERMEWVVEIENFDDCPRYMAHLCRGIRVGPSPAIVRRRLLAIGQRPINNVVDITNYVMFELGQPLHAFDRGKLSGTRLAIRRAAPGTAFTMLDGSQRILGPEHLVIADTAGPVALAGVMGGARSEVDARTVEVLLESALFHPLLVRRTARSLGIVTESSYRFEREADWNMVERAAQRALHLFQQHAGGRMVPERVDRQNPDRTSQAPIPLRMAQVNRLLGTELETAEAAQVLQSLDLTVVPLGQARNRKSGAANLTVEVPSFRRDLKSEVDLIEEIARVRGYDRIPAGGGFRGAANVARRPIDRLRERLRGYLAALGYAEIVTSSFLEREDLDRLELATDDRRRRCLAVANPLHGAETLLRTTLLPALLRAMARNINADNGLPIRLFQAHKVFLASTAPRPELRHPDEVLLPDEPLLFQCAVGGRRDTVYAGLPASLFEIKGLLETLPLYQPVRWRLAPGGDEPYLDGAAQWSILTEGGERVGWAGSLSSRVLSAFEIEEPVAALEIDLGRLPLDAPSAGYRPFARFPAVKRDLSLVVPEGRTYGQVVEVLREVGGALLEDVELFDLYRGKGLPPGAAALGIRLKFRSPRGNLKGSTVDKSIEQTIAALAERLGVRLRS